MKFPYGQAMKRLILPTALAAIVLTMPAGAARAVATFSSAKQQADVVACLADQIREFDNPNVAPTAGGGVSITTHVLHVTRINITVLSGATTKVEVRNRVKGKMKKIIDGCL